MTRRMYDSVTARHIPTNAAMVAGYVNGTYAWSDADWNRFPHARKVRIATNAGVNDGHVLDVEPGCATPTQAVAWVRKRRAAGTDPTVYAPQLGADPSYNLAACRAAFYRAGVAQPHYWVARYNGDPTLPAGCVAKQYLWDNSPCYSGGHYDISSVADYWPGVDPKPGGVVKPATPKPVVVPKPNLLEDSSVIVLIYKAGTVTHVALNVGGIFYPLSAGPANNAYVRAVSKGELPWLALTVTEWNDAIAKSKKLLGA